MRVIINVRGSDSTDSLREMISRRARLVLGRFAAEIARVVITVDAGAAPRCQVSVRGRSSWQVLARDEASWPGAAAIHALDRAARDVARRLDRALGCEPNRLQRVSPLGAALMSIRAT